MINLQELNVNQKKQTEVPSSLISLPILLQVFAVFGVAFCLFQGHGDSAPTTKPIAEIQIFDRVTGRNPLREEVDDALREPTQESYRIIHCELEKSDDTLLQIQLARPQQWIQAQEIQPNKLFFIDLPEMGAVGYAMVSNITECPAPKSGSGALVTGLFRHLADETIDIHIAGEPKPIGCTPNHPFWSEDRQEFVRADSLLTGEQVRSKLHGITRITSITPRDGPETVYNIEVHGEHVYQVGSLGTLVHNSCLLAEILR